MNSRIYWTLLLYSIFTAIMFKDYSGWADALSTVLWLAATIYLSYNLQWGAYSPKLTKFEPVVRRRGKKTKVTFHCTYTRRDSVADIGFWLIWLGVLFVLDLLGLMVWVVLILLAAALIIAALVAIAHIANNVRPVYNELVQWLVWARAKARYHWEKITSR